MSDHKGGLPIRIEGVTKSYGKVTALECVDLAIGRNELVTLLGPSGSGKTTLLMILAGFVRPTAGEVRFGDRPMVRVPPHRRDVGMVFQSYALFPHLSVFDNVAYPLRVRRVPRAEIVDRVGRALELVRLAGYGGRRIHELSGGQGQRVALARSIVFEPRILLMDEPLSALDKKLREHMQVEIRRLHEQLGITTVYVTHDQREALTMSDRIVVIDQGRLQQVGSPREIYDRPATGFVAGFIGESSFVPVRRDGASLLVDGVALKGASAPAGTGALHLVLRPEKLRLVSGETSDPRDNLLGGTVRQAVFQGDSVLLYVALGDGTEVLVRDAPRLPPDRGAAVTLALAPEDVLVIAGDGR